MFVAEKELKRLMKEAYKASSLVIGSRDGLYYLQGNYWKFLCKKEFVTNAILAAMIELTGEIPAKGECYCAGPDGNQIQINPMAIDTNGLREEVAVTDYLLVGERGVVQRILQNESGRVYLINNKFTNMISGLHCDEDNGELPPRTPVVLNKCMAYWENNVMRFVAVLRKDERYKSVLEQMALIDLLEKDEVEARK